MARHLLSAPTCKTATSEGLKIRKLNDGDGLYLFIHDDGAKYWRLRYRFDEKEKLLSVGVFPDISLADARKRADELRKQIANGQDPSVNRQKAKAEKKVSNANTFEVVAREWFGKQVATWAPSHTRDVKRRLEKDLFPSLGKRPIGEITAPELLAAVRKIEARGATDLAHRVLGVAGQVFRYGVATGRCVSDVSRDLRGALTPHQKTNQAAVEEKGLPDLMRAVAAYDKEPINGDTQTRLALQLIALTFVRTNELIGATWDEIDMKAAMWVIPGARMKGGKDHLVPLAKQPLAILKELKTLAGDSEYVLPGRNSNKPLSNNTILFALYRLGYKGKMTGHGFRAVASTWLNESGKFEADWVEAQLAHTPSNEVRSAYNRAKYLPARTKMMAAWANHIDTITGNKVVPLKAAKAS